MSAPATPLPELASVYWRPRTDERELRRAERLWMLTTAAHCVPLVGVAVVLMVLQPLAAPVAAMSLAQAWIIPALYAQRGANVLRPKKRTRDGAERVAVGLLGDLVGHAQRELHSRTGLVVERGSLGAWLVG